MSALQLAALLGLSCTALFAVFGRAPYRDEFHTPLRRVLALLLWFAVLTVIVFLPVANLQEGDLLEPDTIWFPSLFIGHVLLCCFLLAWWRLRNDVDLRSFLGIARGALGERLARGIFIGLTGWGLTIAVT